MPAVDYETDGRIARVTLNRPEVMNAINDELPVELAARMASVPINQLAMQKLVINQASEQTGMMQTQRLATIFDGITRHSPEGINFKTRAEAVGWKQAVTERDEGTWDWTANEALPRRNR